MRDVLCELSLSTHGLDDHAADLDGVGAGAVGVRADLDEAVVQREAPADVRREDVGAVPQEGDLQVEALEGDSIQGDPYGRGIVYVDSIFKVAFSCKVGHLHRPVTEL